MDQENSMDETPSEKSSFFDKERNLRLSKFVIVSLVGLGLNYLFLFLMMLILESSGLTGVLFKIWTFKKQEKEVEFNTFWQFIKFAIVGASGTVINLGLVYVFYDLIGWNEYLAVTIGFVVSVLTNFILNDIWTFNPKFGKEREK